MKKIYTLLTALVLTIAISAQTLNVQVGNVTYQFPSSQTGEMTYQDGSTLTVQNRTFNISDITSMSIDQTSVTDNLVDIVYNGSSATVTVAGNVAPYVTATINGAHVTIVQSNTEAVDDDEITYQLSGSTTNGSFSLGGSYKCTVSLAGLTLTNPNDDAHTDEYMKKLALGSEEARLIKYADLIENTSSFCYSLHEPNVNDPAQRAKDFYLPILTRTTDVLSSTTFELYPKTAEPMQMTLKVYTELLLSRIRLLGK